MPNYQVFLKLAGKKRDFFFFESKERAEDYVRNVILPPNWTQEKVEAEFNKQKHKMYTSEGLEVFSMYNSSSQTLGRVTVTIEKVEAL